MSYYLGDLNVDWERRVDYNQIREVRVKKLREQMKKYGLDAILVQCMDNIRYVTGFRPVYQVFTQFVRNAVLLPYDGEPTAFITGFDAARAEETMPWLKRVIRLPSLVDPEMARLAAKNIFKPIFQECGLINGVIGIDGALFHFIRALEEEIPAAKFVSASDAFYEARVVKTDEEIWAMRSSVARAEVAMEAGLDEIEVGKTENEISGLILKTIHEMGAEYGWAMVISGEKTGVPFYRVPTDKRIRNGDFVMFDVGAYYNGYHSDFARTSIVGKPTEKQKKIYYTVLQAIEAACEAIKPGKKNWEVHNAASEQIRKAGYTEKLGVLSTALPGWITGHGIGTSLHEPPIIGEQGYKEMELKPGMTFSLEPSIHVAGVGGARIEEELVITDKGAEILTKTSRLEEKFV